MRHFFLSVVILGGVILCVTGCKKDNNNSNPNPGTEFPSELVQTWKAVSVDGKTIVTDKTKVLNIKDAERADLMERLVYDTIPVWQTMASDVFYNNDTLKIIGSIDNPFTRVVQTYKIMELTGDRLKMKLLSEVVNDKYKPDNIGQETVFESVASNVDAKIAGMWKTTAPYDLDPFGLYFNTKTYDYYYYNSSGGSTIKSNHDGYYWFYGNFIVLRYKNAPNTDDQKTYVECWNLKLVETTDPENPKNMTLTTLHEDGTQESIPFRFIGVL